MRVACLLDHRAYKPYTLVGPPSLTTGTGPTSPHIPRQPSIYLKNCHLFLLLNFWALILANLFRCSILPNILLGRTRLVLFISLSLSLSLSFCPIPNFLAVSFLPVLFQYLSVLFKPQFTF